MCSTFFYFELTSSAGFFLSGFLECWTCAENIALNSKHCFGCTRSVQLSSMTFHNWDSLLWTDMCHNLLLLWMKYLQFWKKTLDCFNPIVNLSVCVCVCVIRFFKTDLNLNQFQKDMKLLQHFSSVENVKKKKKRKKHQIIKLQMY